MQPVSDQWIGRYVRISKVGEAGGGFPASTWEKYYNGEANEDYSLPINYWSEGFLATEPEPGARVVLDRTNRNGAQIDGLLSTSPVVSVEPLYSGLRVTTQNSVYIISPRPQ